MNPEKVNLKLIDKSSREDVKQFLSIVQSNYQNTAVPLTEEKIRTSDNQYYFAFLSERLVGTTGICFKTPFLAETIKTVVMGEHRGAGLGKLISQAVEDECSRLGVKKVMTTIYATNHTMLSIKLKQGYVIEGYHPDHEAPGFHEYSLGKIL